MAKLEDVRIGLVVQVAGRGIVEYEVVEAFEDGSFKLEQLDNRAELYRNYSDLIVVGSVPLSQLVDGPSGPEFAKPRKISDPNAVNYSNPIQGVGHERAEYIGTTSMGSHVVMFVDLPAKRKFGEYDNHGQYVGFKPCRSPLRVQNSPPPPQKVSAVLVLYSSFGGNVSIGAHTYADLDAVRRNHNDHDLKRMVEVLEVNVELHHGGPKLASHRFIPCKEWDKRG